MEATSQWEVFRLDRKAGRRENWILSFQLWRLGVRVDTGRAVIDMQNFTVRTSS